MQLNIIKHILKKQMHIKIKIFKYLNILSFHREVFREIRK